ncbi:hypothetical protein LCGC14_1619260 [marine sediment metagenome]|uniref:Uncharacterized protein n=1 Tax=marine sediment metagenome TaxID=412755 RepID=A0A0F9ISW8_9ZZZZ
MGDSYNMKIPQDLANFFQKYIDIHKELGYKFVSQYVLHVLQDHAKELLPLEDKVQMERKQGITLETGTYTKEELLRLFEDQKQ